MTLTLTLTVIAVSPDPALTLTLTVIAVYADPALTLTLTVIAVYDDPNPNPNVVYPEHSARPARVLSENYESLEDEKGRAMKAKARAVAMNTARPSYRPGPRARVRAQPTARH